jgi:hypothetical protein
VVPEAHTFTENYNMSVMNPPVPKDLDLAGNATFPTFIKDDSAFSTMEAGGGLPRQRIFQYTYVNRSKSSSLLSTNCLVGRRSPWSMLHNLFSSTTRCSTCLHI